MIARTVILLVVSVLIAGCAVRFTQLESAKRLLTPDGGSRELAKYAWELSLNGTRLSVYPVRAVGRNVLFANGNGLRLTWDGETLIVLEGFPGALGRLETGVEGHERWYAREGFPVFRAACTPMRSWRLSDSRFGWRQECTGALAGKTIKTTHLLELDDQRNIRLIEATLVPGNPAVRLRRLAP